MSGISELKVLLASLSPELSKKEYVFCTIRNFNFGINNKSNPIATFKEDEGITLVLEKKIAKSEKLHFEEVFKKITLRVHSSLMAVGLTAAASTALAKNGISANVIAAYHHDHIFVPKDKAKLALEVLQSLSQVQ